MRNPTKKERIDVLFPLCAWNLSELNCSDEQLFMRKEFMFVLTEPETEEELVD